MWPMSERINSDERDDIEASELIPKDANVKRLNCYQ